MKHVSFLIFILALLVGGHNNGFAQRKDCKTKILPKNANPGVSLTAIARGVPPFRYHWSTGETTQSIVVSKPGNYCVKVEDAEGCMSDACFELRDKSQGGGGGKDCRTKIQPKRTGNNGEVELTARSTGKGPFRYHWSTGETTQSIVVSKPGKYCVKVEDAEGCMSDACFELRDKSQGGGGGKDCRTKIQPKRTGNNGEVELTARSTGKGPFRYHWSTGETTQSIVVSKPGKYCVKVEDAEGCMSESCFVLRNKRDKRKKKGVKGANNTRAVQNGENAYIRNIKVYPNPIREGVEIELEASEGQLIQVDLMDMEGKVLYRVLSIGQPQTTTVNVSAQDLKSGYYFIRVVSDQQEQTIKVIKI